MPNQFPILKPLQEFANAVAAKMNQPTPGEPEDQIRGPFENLVSSVAEALGVKVICTGETPLPDRLGRPDYAVHLNNLLAGYVELKAPGIGANHRLFKGHNRDQFRRFSAIPNILYSDGNQWALYRDGELINRIVVLDGDICTEGFRAVTESNASAVESLFRDFLSWEPIPPISKGKIDLKRFASILAPLTRMLREDVTDALRDPASPLVQLAIDWRKLLFPDATDTQFADAYAQTVSFALLLGRSEGADPLTLDSAEKTLASDHNLLARALNVLTDPGARSEMTASLDVLIRMIGSIPSHSFSGPHDPWLYFYEDFLAEYDPKLRMEAGAYYTPIEVVRCQIKLIDDILVNRLNKPMGFVDPGVITLDPAVGTGTYLLCVVDHALTRVEVEQGAGAVAGKATDLAHNLFGFEFMVGPYAVTELRLSRSLRDRGARLPKGGIHVFLTDTLESPNAIPPSLPYYLTPISDQHAKALKVKNQVPVIVCLGNPPYDRHDAVDPKDELSLSRCGGWVRFGDSLVDDTILNKRGKKVKLRTAKARLRYRQQISILNDYVLPATEAGHGVHVKNLYNLYVYFWRWATWKVFEQSESAGPGITSFITASSYLDGDAFCGMREHLRRQCDEIWIIDLGGEGRGTRKEDNVFAIQTPVAIAIAFRSGSKQTNQPARTHYVRIEGTRAAKLSALDGFDSLKSVHWVECSNDWHAPFLPTLSGEYFGWPKFTDLMPWRHSGAQVKRTWPIGPTEDVLRKRWDTLLSRADKTILFKETRDRKVGGTYPSLFDANQRDTSIAGLSKGSITPRIERYGYRSFDRQWIIADTRIGDFLRPDLWRVHSDRQIYLSSLYSQALGSGPAVVVSAIVPDLDHFRGSFGAKAVSPLYRDADASEPNLHPAFLKLLETIYQRTLTSEEVFAYLYGVMAQPAFTELFKNELETRDLHVPITTSVALFEKACNHGSKLLWLHTYGERYLPPGSKTGQVPSGNAKCTKAVPGTQSAYPLMYDYDLPTQTLRVGDGEFYPVSQDVYEFSVSGLKVVQSWLKYRIGDGAGKKSSPLDDIRPEYWTSQLTSELLELIWILEATLGSYPDQAQILEEIIAGECITADSLPPVPENMRKPARTESSSSDQLSFFDIDDA